MTSSNSSPFELTSYTSDPPGSLLGLDGEHVTQLQGWILKGKSDEEMHELDSFFQGCWSKELPICDGI